MSNMVYSGIGSCKTPPDILEIMLKISSKLEILGYTLRSSHATSADQFFENGVLDINKKEIYLVEHATKDAIEMAKKYHPNLDKLDTHGKKLHGRNVMIVLGSELYLPSDFIIAWTSGGEFVGGIRTTLKVAVMLNIPIFNLYFQTSRERLEKFLNKPIE